jgi:hypothetical protein
LAGASRGKSEKELDTEKYYADFSKVRWFSFWIFFILVLYVCMGDGALLGMPPSFCGEVENTFARSVAFL